METEKTAYITGAGQRPPFRFRGNAVAGAGYLTKLDNKPVQLKPDVVTVHCQTSLPVIGGVSHVKIGKPDLAWPDWISYDSCETFAEGVADGESAVTTVRASVNNVRVMTRPSPGDAPGVQSSTFRADGLAIGVRSVHPLRGEPAFELLQPAIGNLSFTRTFVDKVPRELPIKLEFDDVLMGLRTLSAIDKEFMENEEFFNQHASRYRASSGEKLVFSKSPMPRTPTGYIVTSIVKRITLGDEVIQGNVLTQSGFGRIEFGTTLINGYNRRISLATIFIGSDPDGDVCCAEVDTNGSWGN